MRRFAILIPLVMVGCGSEGGVELPASAQESAADADGTIRPFSGPTDIFITPGYRFRAIDGLMTNFHLPKSTLFMLVSAFSGLETMKAAYGHAIANGYRFYSYGDSSLLHTAPGASRDLESEENTRIYHFAGTQHGAGTLPQKRGLGAESALGRYAYNVVDYSPLLRAALVNLEKWITQGIEPPPSTHAQIESETAVARDAVLDVFDKFPGQVTPGRSKLWIIRTIDLGPRAGEGIGVYPPAEGETYPCLVSAVDHDGNELAGIRLPDLTRPVASHAGWNVRDPDTGSPDQQIPMLGFTKWFPATKSEREAAGDPRLSLEERYPDRAHYAALVQRDAEALVRDGFVLELDFDLVVQNAVDRYDVATARIPETRPV